MLGFFKKNCELIAPASGKVLDLSEVPDKVFSEKLVGDGVAIELSSDTIVAPANGELSLLFKTFHAFGITLESGVEILVHIGIDTVKLEGKGFEPLVEQGETVKVGQPIIKVDREFIKEQGFSLITPVLITNPELVADIEYSSGIDVDAGNHKLFTYKLK
ncbi:PTS glucose transporter subunit IIA [Clostridium acetobutylicum]|nr:PTS glucose transporter subunit IIA [Clostridium acetobutylicum]